MAYMSAHKLIMDVFVYMFVCNQWVYADDRRRRKENDEGCVKSVCVSSLQKLF